MDENIYDKTGTYKPRDAIEAAFRDASTKATLWAKDDGLHPEINEWSERRYRLQQGLRAAHVGREDSAATLLLMMPVLYGLRRLNRLLWVVILLATAILWRVW